MLSSNNRFHDELPKIAFLAAKRGDLDLIQVLLGPNIKQHRERYLNLLREIHQIKLNLQLNEFRSKLAQAALTEISIYLALDRRYQAITTLNETLSEKSHHITEEAIHSATTETLCAERNTINGDMPPISPSMLEEECRTRFNREIIGFDLQSMKTTEHAAMKADMINDYLLVVSDNIKADKTKLKSITDEKEKINKKFSERLDSQLRILNTYKSNPEKCWADTVKDNLENYIYELECIKQLDEPILNPNIQAWLDPNLMDEKGNTLAHHAAAEKNYHLLNYLIKMGTSLDARNDNDQTPAQLCYLTESELARIIQQYEDITESELVKSLLEIMHKYKQKADAILFSSFKAFLYRLFYDIETLKSRIENDIPAYLSLIEKAKNDPDDKRLVVEGIPIALNAKRGALGRSQFHADVIALFRKYHAERGFGRHSDRTEEYSDTELSPVFFREPGLNFNNNDVTPRSIRSPGYQNAVRLRIIQQQALLLSAAHEENRQLTEQLSQNTAELAKKDTEMSELKSTLNIYVSKSVELESKVETLMAFMKNSRMDEAMQARIVRSQSPEGSSPVVSEIGIFQFTPDSHQPQQDTSNTLPHPREGRFG